MRATPMMWFAETAHSTLRLAASDPWRYVTLVAGPTTLILVVTKLLKYTVSMSAGSRETSAALGGATAALVEHAPMPLLLLGAAFLVAAILQLRFAHLGSVFLPAVVATCALGSSAVMAVLDNPPAWASLGFVEVIRSDLLLCVSVASVCATLVILLRFVRLPVLAVLHFVCIGTGVLAIVDAAYFLKTGSLADSYLLWYALTNLEDLRYVLQHELSVGAVALISAPVVLSFAPVVVANMRSTSRVDLHRATPAWRTKRGYVLAILASAALSLTPAIPLKPVAAVLRPSTPQALLGFVGSASGTGISAASARIEPMLDISSDYRWVETDSSRAWNVVVVVLESTRANSFGAIDTTGAGHVVTPFLDSLVHVGLSSRDVAAIVPHTNKALVSILCGVPPPLNQGRTAVAVPTCLPQLLGRHGYASAFFTPANLAFEGKGDLLRDMGFDDAFGDEVWPPGDYAVLNYFGREDRIILKPTMAWMNEKRRASQPFVATVLTLVPHHDYGLPPGFPRHEYVADREMNMYLNALRYQDDFLRELYLQMESGGYLDDTILLVVGDHGEAFAEHGLRYHSGVTYQEGLLVPLAVVAPADADSIRVAGPRSQLDALPTVASLLRLVEQGGALPGQSLLRPSRSDSLRKPAPRRLFAASWLENQSMALRDGDRKYVYHFRRRPMEVFDLDDDPFEMNDLASQSTTAEQRAAERDLLGWRAATNAFHEQIRNAAAHE